MQGIEFNLAPIEEDNQIGFKQGYKEVVSCHHADSNGQIDVEDPIVLVQTQVNRPNE